MIKKVFFSLVNIFIGSFMCAMEGEDMRAPSLTVTQRLFRVVWQCCMPKVVKLCVTTCICRKNCTEAMQLTVTSSSEYRIVQCMQPVVMHPYCWAATACACGVVGVGCMVHQNGLCETDQGSNREQHNDAETDH